MISSEQALLRLKASSEVVVLLGHGSFFGLDRCLIFSDKLGRFLIEPLATTLGPGTHALLLSLQITFTILEFGILPVYLIHLSGKDTSELLELFPLRGKGFLALRPLILPGITLSFDIGADSGALRLLCVSHFLQPLGAKLAHLSFKNGDELAFLGGNFRLSRLALLEDFAFGILALLGDFCIRSRLTLCKYFGRLPLGKRETLLARGKLGLLCA